MSNQDVERGLTISELLARARLSDRKLEELSGNTVGRETFRRYKKGEFQGFPDVEIIRGVAETLDITDREVLFAFARQLGIAAPGRNSLLSTMLPAETEALSFEQAHAISDLIRAFAPGEPSARLAVDITTWTAAEQAEMQALYADLLGKSSTASERVKGFLSPISEAIKKAIEEAAEDEE